MTYDLVDDGEASVRAGAGTQRRFAGWLLDATMTPQSAVPVMSVCGPFPSLDFYRLCIRSVLAQPRDRVAAGDLILLRDRIAAGAALCVSWFFIFSMRHFLILLYCLFCPDCGCFDCGCPAASQTSGMSPPSRVSARSKRLRSL